MGPHLIFSGAWFKVEGMAGCRKVARGSDMSDQFMCWSSLLLKTPVTLGATTYQLPTTGQTFLDGKTEILKDEVP